MRLYTVPSNDAVMTEPEPGLRRQMMSSSEKMTLVRHLQAKGWKGARHSHPHEQLLYVLRGLVRVKVAQEGGDDQVFEMRAGESLILPGGVEHEAESLEESEVLDVFTPMRIY